ncbi:hypothetical protein ZWY2020_053673 [Hordeum vulgare]|nr:hypothetical protein ZWY2020_053673 [Hordeum vulgare]
MAAEWTDDNTRIVTELFAEQVGVGNRPNTHLTSNKLRLRETGAGWDYERNTVKQDDEWWKKAKQEIKGVGKFRKQGLRNEANLKVMFEDIMMHAMNVDDIHDCDFEEAPPIPADVGASGSVVTRLGKFIHDNSKKPKTAHVMQEEITRIGNIAEKSQSSFKSFIKNDETTSVTSVMDEVIACGPNEGSYEHFIATELFIKRDQREMFMHMSAASRLGWLRRKYDNKYPK